MAAAPALTAAEELAGQTPVWSPAPAATAVPATEWARQSGSPSTASEIALPSWPAQPAAYRGANAEPPPAAPPATDDASSFDMMAYGPAYSPTPSGSPTYGQAFGQAFGPEGGRGVGLPPGAVFAPETISPGYGPAGAPFDASGVCVPGSPSSPCYDVIPNGLIAPPPLACQNGSLDRTYDGSPVGPPTDFLSRALAVRLDTPTSAALLDFQNRQTDKQLIILGSIPSVVDRPTLVPGAQMRLSGIYGRTNTRNKFGYLGRFPTDFVGNTATDLRILQANLAATAYFTPWAAGYAETLFSDVFSFPTFDQGSLQMRQAYAVFGDVNRFPLYAFIGKKTVSYGDFSTLSPFTQAVPWHYFAALGEGAGVGFVQGGFHLVLTGLTGGRGIRTSDSPSNGRVNNYAVNASYAQKIGDFEYLVGAGYLDGTIYNADSPEHTDVAAFGPQNGAWDVNGFVRWRRLTLAAEWVQTNMSWPVTDYEVSAYKAEAAVDVSMLGKPLRLSTSWSEGKQAQTGLEWDKNGQLVVGAGWQLNPNALLSLEYVQSVGFAPLIGLTAPGVSDRDVRQNSLVLGVSLAL